MAQAVSAVLVGMAGDGALIRSASASGITGYTPTFGAIPRRGVRDVAPSLDAPGVCARSISGVALLAECLFGNDLADPSTEATPHPQLLAQAGMTPPVVPTLYHQAYLSVLPLRVRVFRFSEPVSSGPLSLEKATIVLPAIPALSRASRTCPTLLYQSLKFSGIIGGDQAFA